MRDVVILDEATEDAVCEWRECAPHAAPTVDAEWQAVLTIADWQAAFEPVTVDDALAWGVDVQGEKMAEWMIRDTIAKGKG